MKTYIITAGGTHEHIDDVRYITNHATGELPARMAEILLSQGHNVVYVHGPGAILPAQTQNGSLIHDSSLGICDLVPVVSAADMHRELTDACQRFNPDAVICAAAVADFAPIKVAGKISSRKDAPGGHTAAPDDDGSITLKLYPTPKVIDVVKASNPNTTVRLLGFKFLAKATEEELLAAGRHLMQRSKADAVFCNTLESYKSRTGILMERQFRYEGWRGWVDPLVTEETHLSGGTSSQLAKLILATWSLNGRGPK